MDRKGFGLIEILIAVVVIAILTGGGLYLKNIQNQQSIVQTGLNAEQQAQQAVQKMSQQSGQEQNSLNQLASSTASTSAISANNTLPISSSETLTYSPSDAAAYARINASVYQHYNNKTYNFSFTYPGFLSVNGDSNSSSIILSQNATSSGLETEYALSVSMIDNPSHLSVQQYFSDDSYDNGADLYTNASVSTTTFNDISATIFHGSTLYNMTTNEVIIVPYEGGFLEIVNNNLDDYTYHWILSSFFLITPDMAQSIQDASNITTSSVVAAITNWNAYVASSSFQLLSDSDCAPADPQFSAYLTKVNSGRRLDNMLVITKSLIRPITTSGRKMKWIKRATAVFVKRAIPILYTLIRIS